MQLKLLNVKCTINIKKITFDHVQTIDEHFF